MPDPKMSIERIALRNSSASMNRSAPNAIGSVGFSRSSSRVPRRMQPILAAMPTGKRSGASR